MALADDVIAALLEAYTPDGQQIWLRSWLKADHQGRSRMESGVLAAWSGQPPIEDV